MLSVRVPWVRLLRLRIRCGRLAVRSHSGPLRIIGQAASVGLPARLTVGRAGTPPGADGAAVRLLLGKGWPEAASGI